MDLEQYLFEEVALATLSNSIKNLEKIFNYGLKQVYEQSFLTKIEEQIKEVVRIRERPSKRINEVAWIDGFNVIYVNPQPFYSLTKEKQVSTLLHEFIHLLHSSRKFLFFNKFPEVKKLTKSLYIIVKNGLTQGSTLGSFIANRKDVSLKYLNKEEILAYLMTGSINWNAITKEAKEKVIQELKDSNMFNLTSNFWIKRLK